MKESDWIEIPQSRWISTPVLGLGSQIGHQALLLVGGHPVFAMAKLRAGQFP